MDNRRFALAVGLSAVLIFIWGLLFPQLPTEPPRVDPAGEMTEPVEEQGSRGESPAPLAERAAEPPGEPVVAAGEETIRIETDLFATVWTNRGAVARSWQVSGYGLGDREALELFPEYIEGEPAFFAIELDDPELAAQLNEALWVLERDRSPGEQKLIFRWSDGLGTVATKTLTFRDDSFLVGLDLEVEDRGRRKPARVVLGPGFAVRDGEGARSTHYYESQAAWNANGDVTRMRHSKLTDSPARFDADLRWVGLEDQYFAALVLPEGARTTVQWTSVDRTRPAEAADEEPESELYPVLSVGIPAEGAELYLGPKNYRLLLSLGHDLHRSVWFASSAFLGTIARYIFLGLLWIYDHTIQNYGMAIVLATFVLRVVLFPVNQFAMVSMKKTQVAMQALQPKVNAIKKRYSGKKDAESRNKMHQEMMELYRVEGVNPMGGITGCLPMLAQFPILIGFYNMLTVAIELRGAPFFGWIQDLSRADPYWITPLLMGVTMFLQQKLAMTKVKDPQQLQQQRIMMFMPFVFTYVCIQMPAGLVLYWFVNNVLGIGQQWLVNRQTARLETAPQKA